MKKLLILAALGLFGMSAPAQSPAASLTDNQIAQVVVTLNNGEIDAAKIAERKAKNSEVKKFAKMMEDHHKKNKTETKSMARKNSLSMEKSELNRTLHEDATTARKDLKRTETAQFDKTYIDQQVTLHQAALNTFDTTLIPNAKNSDLRTHLEKTRTAVADHLEQAKTIRTKLH